MSNPPSGRRERSAPLSIRFTETEKARLQDKAGSVPLGTFIRQTMLDDGMTPPRWSRRSYPVKDGEALGRLLGLLGQSRIANNLNQLAKAANLGTLPVLKETEDSLNAACAGVLEMRRLLLTALGIVIMDQARSGKPLSASFAEKADGSRS
ncbi:plasmid mobilization relaxosome protein MobC [uncultured Bradyrhizobium sp.]|uniref:plasmid mobilization relaxosome protein MobC n=1 Tax=uncultured Bradyrhizobium sp. TaxID=199684 RepID=UPI0035CC5CA2